MKQSYFELSAVFKIMAKVYTVLERQAHTHTLRERERERESRWHLHKTVSSKTTSAESSSPEIIIAYSPLSGSSTLAIASVAVLPSTNPEYFSLLSRGSKGSVPNRASILKVVAED